MTRFSRGNGDDFLDGRQRLPTACLAAKATTRLFGNDRQRHVVRNDGNDAFDGANGDDVLVGGNGIPDNLFGCNGIRHVLDGGNGDDALQGGFGDEQRGGRRPVNDQLSDGGGNDTLDGGNGDDFLKGCADIRCPSSAATATTRSGAAFGNDSLMGGDGV